MALETKLDDFERKIQVSNQKIATSAVKMNEYETQVSELTSELMKKDDVIGNLKLKLGSVPIKRIQNMTFWKYFTYFYIYLHNF